MPPKLPLETKNIEEIVNKYLNDEKIQDIIEKTLESEAVQELIKSIANAVMKPVQEKINNTCKEASERSELLEDKQSRLEERVENLEKQNKMKNIRIVGLPEDTPTENLNAKIKDLTRDMGMNPDETMSTVDTVLRPRKPTKNNATKPRHILLTFKSIESRNKFIRSRRNLKGKRKGLAVLEDLTRENAKRYYEGRQLYKQEEIVAVWTQGGVVYIKQAEEAKPTTYDDYIKDRRI